ncbi:MAG: ABC transporter substrate-binding protein [Deltaproteobacteria bacterium]|nr:ABC transporter substrate-binding protein [Deltaproteobacteria bacterium]
MNIRHSLAASLSVILVLGFAGFARSQDKPEKIIVGVAGLSGPLAHAFIPKDSGLYEKYGLDVDLVFFQGGSQLIQATVAGSVKIAVTAGPEVVNARVGGSDMAIILGYMNTLPYSIVTSKNVTKFEQLKGKSAAISRFGTTSDLAMRYALEKNGLAPNKDVTIVQLGDQTTRFAGLTGGSVHATVISPPFDITARKLGYNILADMADLGLPYQHETVATTERFLKERPETARKFVRGFLAGIHLWMTDEKRTKEILAKRLKINDPEILAETYAAYKKLTEKKPYPTLKGIEFQIEDVAKKNPKAKGMKPEEFINITLLKELDQNGFIDSLYKK